MKCTSSTHSNFQKLKIKSCQDHKQVFAKKNLFCLPVVATPWSAFRALLHSLFHRLGHPILHQMSVWISPLPPTWPCQKRWVEEWGQPGQALQASWQTWVQTHPANIYEICTVTHLGQYLEPACPFDSPLHPLQFTLWPVPLFQHLFFFCVRVS